MLKVSKKSEEVKLTPNLGRYCIVRERTFDNINEAYEFRNRLNEANFEVGIRCNDSKCWVIWVVETREYREPRCPRCREILNSIAEDGKSVYRAMRHRDGNSSDHQYGDEEGESWSCPLCFIPLHSIFVEKHFIR